MGNPFGDDLVPYFQGSCKLVSDNQWAGNVSHFQDLRYSDDGGYKPISISAAVRELDDESYCFGVFADYKHDDTSMMKLDGSYIGIRDTKTHSFVASCQIRVEAKNAEDFEGRH